MINRIVSVNRFDASAYKCFKTLEEYAKLLTNFTDFKKFHPKNLLGQDCATIAKSTLHHKKGHKMTHNFWDLREILFQTREGLRDKVILSVRTEFIWIDWESANRWLGDTGEIFRGRTIRSAKDVGVPVNVDLSSQGRDNLCLALRDEYRLYLKLLVLSENLSKQQLADSLAIARKNCPCLALELPDRNSREVFEASQGLWEL